LALAAAVLAAGPARADGAFPDGQSILAPADRPDEILLATNFGLVTSADAGRTWIWSCELPVSNYGRLYQLGPPPARRLYAIASGKLIFSDDAACGWQAAGGALSAQLAEDAFVDPSDGSHVLAIGLATGAGGTVYSLLASTDGGSTFGGPVYTAASGDLLTGIEIAASDPRTLVLALAHGPTGAPTLAVSTDGGLTWTLTDLTAALGAGQLRIVAIDPNDADRVFLRQLGPSGDALAVATHAGATVTAAVTFAAGALTAFVRTSAGTLLAAGTAAGAPVLFRSTDDGATFGAVAQPPHVLALAARSGIVYAATDTTFEPYAEATSTDDGTTWTPGLTFGEVAAIAPCLMSACQSDCAARAGQQQWPAAVCAATVVPTIYTADGGLIDAGPPDAVQVRVPQDGGLMRVDAGDVVVPPRPGGGCACATAAPPGAWAGLLFVVPLAALLRRRRR
jgi:MYXO-CTERM domain-containing protein